MCDLTCEYVTRLLNHMKGRQARRVGYLSAPQFSRFFGSALPGIPCGGAAMAVFGGIDD